MLNLIIVDDEKTTRNNLLTRIPWAELGIEAVKNAANGLAALAIAEDFRPSILLTDIRMPKMDGIELSKNIRQLYPDCEIIFLSGYTDKEYLKSAIQLNAVDYLEKPIDIDELKALFIKTVQKIGNDQRKQAEDSQLKDNVKDNIHLLRQEIVSGLVLHQADPFSLLGKYNPEVFQLSTVGQFTVACILFNWTEDVQVEDKSLIKNSILKQLNEKGIFIDFRFLSGFVNDQHLVLIINEKMDSTSQRCKFLWEKLFKLLLTSAQSNFTFAVGCSASSTNLTSFLNMYKAADQILKQQFYQGSYKVFYSPPLPVSSYELDKELYSRFKKLLRSNSVNEVNNLIIQMTKDISLTLDPDINKIKNIYFNLLRILFEVAMQWDIIEAEGDPTNKYIWQELDDKKTLNELSGLLLVNIEATMNKSDNKATTIDKVNEITKYIRNNYKNNKLSILTISKSVYLTPTYLCACFKKATGKTINEFITELRIAEAKELIVDPNIKLYEVAAHIGMADPNYFSTLFKRYVGLTPSEYREKHLYDK